MDFHSPGRQRGAGNLPANIGDLNLQELERLAGTAFQAFGNSKDEADNAQTMLRKICNEGSLPQLLGCLACAGEQTYLPTILCKTIRFIVMHPRDAAMDRGESLAELLRHLVNAVSTSPTWHNHLEEQERKHAASIALASGGNMSNFNYANAARVSLHAIGPLAHLFAALVFCLYADTVRHAPNRPTPMSSQPVELAMFGAAGRQSSGNPNIIGAGMSRDNSGTGPVQIDQHAARLASMINELMGLCSASSSNNNGDSGGSSPALAPTTASSSPFSPLLLHHVKREIVREFTAQPRVCDGDTQRCRLAFLSECFRACVDGLFQCSFSDHSTKQLLEEVSEFLAFLSAVHGVGGAPSSLSSILGTSYSEEALPIPTLWFRDATLLLPVLRFYFSNVAQALMRQQLQVRRERDIVHGFVDLACSLSTVDAFAPSDSAAGSGGGGCAVNGGLGALGLDYNAGCSQSQGTNTAPSSQQPAASSFYGERQGSGISLSQGLSQRNMGLSQQSSFRGGGGGGLFGGGGGGNAGACGGGGSMRDFDWNRFSHVAVMMEVCGGMLRFAAAVAPNNNGGGGGSNSMSQASNQSGSGTNNNNSGMPLSQQEACNLSCVMLEATARILCNITERFPTLVVESLLSGGDLLVQPDVRVLPMDDESSGSPRSPRVESSQHGVSADSLEMLAQFCCRRGPFAAAAAASDDDDSASSEAALRNFMTFSNLALQRLRGVSNSMMARRNQNNGNNSQQEDSLWSGSGGVADDSGNNNNNDSLADAIMSNAELEIRVGGLRDQLQRLTRNCVDATFDVMAETRLQNSNDFDAVPLEVEGELSLATAGSMLLMRSAGDCHFLGDYLLAMFSHSAAFFFDELHNNSGGGNNDGDFYSNRSENRSTRTTLSLVIETVAQAIGFRLSGGLGVHGLMSLSDLDRELTQLLSERGGGAGDNGGGGNGNNNSGFFPHSQLQPPVPANSKDGSQEVSPAVPAAQRCGGRFPAALDDNGIAALQRSIASKLGAMQQNSSNSGNNSKAMISAMIGNNSNGGRPIGPALAGVMSSIEGFANGNESPLRQSQVNYAGCGGSSSAGGHTIASAAVMMNPIGNISSGSTATTYSSSSNNNNNRSSRTTNLDDFSPMLGGPSLVNLASYGGSTPPGTSSSSSRPSFQGLMRDLSTNSQQQLQARRSGPAPVSLLLCEIFRFADQLASSAIDALQSLLENMNVGGSGSSQSSAASPNRSQSMTQQPSGSGGIADGSSTGAAWSSGNNSSTHLSQTARLIRPEHRPVFRSLFFLFRTAAKSNALQGGTVAMAALRLAAFVLRSSGEGTPPILIQEALGTITRLWSSTNDKLSETAFAPVADDLTSSLLSGREIFVMRRDVCKMLFVLEHGTSSGGASDEHVAVLRQCRQDALACFFQRANAFGFVGQRVQCVELARALFRFINSSYLHNMQQQQSNNGNNNNNNNSSGNSGAGGGDDWGTVSFQSLSAARCWIRDVKAAFMPGRSPAHSVTVHVALGVLTGEVGAVECDEISCLDDPDAPGLLDGEVPVAGMMPGMRIVLDLILALKDATASPDQGGGGRQQQQQGPGGGTNPPSPHPRPPRVVLRSFVSLLSDFVDLSISVLSTLNTLFRRSRGASEQLPVYFVLVRQIARVLSEGVATVHSLCAEDRYNVRSTASATEHGDASSITSVDLWSPLRELPFFGPLCLAVWSVMCAKWLNVGAMSEFDEQFRSDTCTLNRFINAGYGTDNLGRDNLAGVPDAVVTAVANMAVLSFSTSTRELTSLLRTLSGQLTKEELLEIVRQQQTTASSRSSGNSNTSNNAISVMHKHSDFGLRSLVCVVARDASKLPPRASACYMGWCATLAAWLRETHSGVISMQPASVGRGAEQRGATTAASVIEAMSDDDDLCHNANSVVMAATSNGRVRRASLLRCLQALLSVTANPAQLLVNPMFRADWVRVLAESTLESLVTNQLAMQPDAATSASAILSKLQEFTSNELNAFASEFSAKCALGMHQERVDFIMSTLTQSESQYSAVTTLVNQLCSSSVVAAQQQQQQQGAVTAPKKNALKRETLHEPGTVYPF